MPVTMEMGTAGGLLYLAVFSTTIAMSLQNIGQSMAPSSHAAILLSLESVFGALASWLLLGERLTGMMIVGFAIIFAALVVNSLKS
jgi:drug/metabolite transporter (DMT)-like permease